jgi:hypothetical protein
MSDELSLCWNCDFKCVRSQFAKTGGYCPKCGTLVDSVMFNSLPAEGKTKIQDKLKSMGKM